MPIYFKWIHLYWKMTIEERNSLMQHLPFLFSSPHIYKKLHTLNNSSFVCMVLYSWKQLEIPVALFSEIKLIVHVKCIIFKTYWSQWLTEGLLKKIGNININYSVFLSEYLSCIFCYWYTNIIYKSGAT